MVRRQTTRGVDRSLATRRAAFVLTLLVVISSLPYLSNYLPYPQGHDLDFHLSRIESIAQGLAQGQVPVRLYPCQAFGFGYPTGICYPDLLLYLPALLRLVGVPLQWAFVVFAVAANALTAVVAYACFRRVFRSSEIGLACATLWTLAPYRLVDVLLRSSVGEYLALAFAPLVVYGVWAVCLDGGKEHPLGWLALATGMASVVLTHVLSVVLLALPGLPLVTVALVRGSRVRPLGAMLLDLGKATFACAGLCAFFVVPFLDYYLSEPMQVSEGVNDVERHVLQPLQLVGTFWPLSGESKPWWEGMANEMPASLGCALSCVLVVALYLPAVRRDLWRRLSGTRRALLATLLVVAALLALMCVWPFPWELAQEEGPVASLVAKLGIIQFPWRLVGPLSLVAVLVAGVLLAGARDADDLPAHATTRRTLAVVVLALCVVEALSAETSFAYNADVFPQESFDEIVAGDAWGIGNGEYLPAQATWERVEKGKGLPEADEDVTVETWSHEATTEATLAATNDVDATAGVTVPLFWNDLWQVTSVAREGTPATPESSASGSGDEREGASSDAATDAADVRLVQDVGFVRVELPSHFSGTVTISFVEPAYWAVAGWTSIACVGFCLWWALRAQRATRDVKRRAEPAPQ